MESKAGLPVRPRRWDSLVWAMGGIFALAIAVNGVMLWFTLRQPIQLVSASYYEDAKNYGQVMAEQRASSATGWQVAVSESADAASPAVSIFSVTDAQGRPVPGLQGTVRAYRPSDAGLDQELAAQEVANGHGRYAFRLKTYHSGHWELTMDLRRGDQRLVQSLAWTAP